MAALDAGEFFIDRDVPANVERDGIVALLEKLELRIEKDELRIISIEVHAAEKYDLTACAEVARLKVGAVKPFHVNEAAAVGENHVEDTAACASF